MEEAVAISARATTKGDAMAMILVGQLIDEESNPLAGLNIRAFVHTPDGTLFFGYDTTDVEGGFALESGEAGRDASPPCAVQRLRFDVLDGNLQLIHQADHDAELDELAASMTVTLVVPCSAATVAAKSVAPNEPGEDAVSEIRVLPERPTVPLGSHLILVAEARDREGIPLSGVRFEWQAKDLEGERVPISQTGELVGHTPGTVEVTATGAGRTGSAVVTVSDPRQALTDPRPASAALGSGDDDADRGPRWNERNADSAFDPTNRIGLGHQRLGLMTGQVSLGLHSEDATEVATVGSANFHASAPVLDLPGRGMDLRLDLVYNSRLWTRSENLVEFDVDKGWPAPGWSLGFGRIVRLGHKGSMLVSPDGTRHPYRVLRLAGDQTRRWVFEGQTTDGTFIDYRHIDDMSGGLQSAQAHYPDGTTVEYTARGHDYPAPNTGQLHSSWGVLFPTRITDVQGNVITITYRNNTGPEIDTIVDTLGRSVTFHYDGTDGRLTAVTGPGLDGARRTLVRLDIMSMNIDPAFSGLTVSTPTRSPRAVRALYYPADYSGYWFGDPGTYSVYGTATKFTRHKNMAFNGAPLTETGWIGPGTLVHQRSYNYPLTMTPGLTDVPAYTEMTEIWEGMDTPPSVTRFAVHKESSPRRVEVIYPNGTRTVTLAYKRPGLFDDGLPYRQEIYDGSRLVQLTTNVWQQGDYATPRLSRVETTREQTPMTATEYDYGPYNRRVEIREFDFGGSSELRRTRTEYALDQGYVGRHILSLPTVVEVFDTGGLAPSVRTEYTYDSQPLKDTPGVIAHLQTHNPYDLGTWVAPYDELECIERPRDKPPDCRTIHHDGYWKSAYDHRTRFRGNLTEIRRFADPARHRDPVVERYWYDITGNLAHAETGRYDRSAYEYSLTTQYAYPERCTIGPADRPDVQIATAAVYDFGTGLLTSATDANGRTTRLEYSPTQLRPVTTTWPTGAKTTYVYDLYQGMVAELIYLADGSLAQRRETVYNGLGMVRRLMTLAVSQADPTQRLYDITENRYDELGRIWAQSAPFRTGETPAWTEVTRDALGRVTCTRAPDGSETRAYYNERAQLPDALDDPTLALGPTTRLVDAWGREKWTWHNALGQLQLVVSPDPDGDGSVFAPGTVATTYVYNPLDQVIWIINQAPGSTPQHRYFRYDGLGRLTHQALTERASTLNDNGEYRADGARWSDVFSYADGTRMAWSMDARGVRTRFDFGDDPLGRLQTITYEQPVTPPGVPDPAPLPEPASAVRYAYATTGDLTRLSKVMTDDMTKRYDYDTEGRLAAITLTFPDRLRKPFVLGYRYDTVHRMRQVIYPSAYGLPRAPRKEIDFGYDRAGRVQRLTVDGVPHADGITYSAQGWPTELTLDPESALPLSERNEPGPVPGLLGRQQVLRDGETLLDLSYQYTRPGLSGITGQLTRMTDNLRPDRTTWYDYDTTARLRKASSGLPDELPLWTQTYSYDLYGNRTGTTATGSTPDGTPIPPDGISDLEYGQLRPDGRRSIHNRLTTRGYAYDEAGNLIRGKRQDGTWQNYRYDMAGRLVAVLDDAGTPWETYTYGACRRRIRSRDERGGIALCHVWDGNAVIAEYDTGSPRTSWVRSFIHLGERLLCTYTPAERRWKPPGGPVEVLRYYHPDRLGSRLITTPETKDTAELTTLPYGTLVAAGSPLSETGVFTSYHRSVATGLDYAVNRHYDSRLGIFLEPDPTGQSALQIGQPQSHNAYAYCQGDPVNHRDPMGLRMMNQRVCVSMDEMNDGAWSCTDYSYPVPDHIADALRDSLRQRERPEQIADRQRGDNRAYDRLIKDWPMSGPRPTTWLDLLFGGYLVTTLLLFFGGLLAVSGETTLASGIGAARPQPTGPGPAPGRTDVNTRARTRERDPDSGTRSGWDPAREHWDLRDGWWQPRQPR
ncbi:RHS repeat-associated core domain-containing protein [Streptomyces canus]|uniref:RHS repeat-associated core domain-containing protein n=1 Tax=Streptomyces canus TaxID=58343 RepID=UPI0033EED905